MRMLPSPLKRSVAGRLYIPLYLSVRVNFLFQSIPVGTGPDNLNVDGETGSIWAGCHPRLIDTFPYLENPRGHKSPSHVRDKKCFRGNSRTSCYLPRFWRSTFKMDVSSKWRRCLPMMGASFQALRLLFATEERCLWALSSPIWCIVKFETYKECHMSIF